VNKNKITNLNQLKAIAILIAVENIQKQAIELEIGSYL
jgi:hypothetical protein